MRAYCDGGVRRVEARFICCSASMSMEDGQQGKRMKCLEGTSKDQVGTMFESEGEQQKMRCVRRRCERCAQRKK